MREPPVIGDASVGEGWGRNNKQTLKKKKKITRQANQGTRSSCHFGRGKECIK